MLPSISAKTDAGDLCVRGSMVRVTGAISPPSSSLIATAAAITYSLFGAVSRRCSRRLFCYVLIISRSAGGEVVPGSYAVDCCFDSCNIFGYVFLHSYDGCY